MSGTDPYVPGHGDASYDVEHYVLDLGYQLDGNRLGGEATLRCVARETLTSFRLDLHRLRVAKVYVDGVSAAKYTHRSGALVVRPRLPLVPGQVFSVRVKYAGRPQPVRSRALGEAGWEELDDGVIVAGQPHGAPSWFPCNDRPDDKATYQLRIAVPNDYYVAFSGVTRSHTRRGSVTHWVFEQSSPMASYLATVQIGRYTVLRQRGPVPMQTVAPRSVRGAGFDAAFGGQPAMMRFFVDRFGPYPFAEYTTVITADELEIPLESQGLSTFGSNYCTDAWHSIRLVAHEMAHQWFGNAVTLRQWKDIWLHEGFACYAEWLWSEEIGSTSAAVWAAYHHGRLAELAQDLVVGDPTPDHMFDDRVYKRGALTLHALRCSVGDDTFFDILRSWVETRRGGSVTTAELVTHCEERSGRTLAPLFDAWLYQEALPPHSS